MRASHDESRRQFLERSPGRTAYLRRRHNLDLLYESPASIRAARSDHQRGSGYAIFDFDGIAESAEPDAAAGSSVAARVDGGRRTRGESQRPTAASLRDRARHGDRHDLRDARREVDQ